MAGNETPPTKVGIVVDKFPKEIYLIPNKQVFIRIGEVVLSAFLQLASKHEETKLIIESEGLSPKTHSEIVRLNAINSIFLKQFTLWNNTETEIKHDDNLSQKITTPNQLDFKLEKLNDRYKLTIALPSHIQLIE